MLEKGYGIEVGHAGDKIRRPPEEGVAGGIGLDVVRRIVVDAAKEIGQDFFGLVDLLAGERAAVDFPVEEFPEGLSNK